VKARNISWSHCTGAAHPCRGAIRREDESKQRRRWVPEQGSATGSTRDASFLGGSCAAETGGAEQFAVVVSAEHVEPLGVKHN